MSPLVILGSGLAGYGLLREFRKLDADTPVTLISADAGQVYSKPNLSNALAQGRGAAQLGGETAEQAALKYHADILPHTRVSGIDTTRQMLRSDWGEIAYGRLVLALGADPIPHGLVGDAAAAVLSVNDLDDYARFRAALDGKRHVAILGGGLIGCEFANDLALTGHAATVVHLGPWPLERMLPEPSGRALARALANQGVAWHFGRRATQVDAVDGGYRLTLDDGGTVTADLVLSAIGLQPRTRLAREAGIAVNRGIVVDNGLATSAAHVYAIGDCAEVDGQVLPFVQPLLLQARALAANLAGQDARVSYPAMPVVVKTSAYPLAVLPPAPGAEGTWRVEEAGTGIRALHLSREGRLNGFALSGGETAKRGELARQAGGSSLFSVSG